MALLGSMYFAGWATTILIVPLIADKKGRKWPFTLSVLVTALTMVGFFLSRKLWFSIMLMYIVGAGNSGRVMVGFVFGQEFLTPFWQVIFGTAFHFIDNSTALITTAYFAYINNHYIYIALVGFVITSFSVVFATFWAPESPIWQLKMGKISEAQATLRRMIKMSGVDASAEIAALEFDIKELNRQTKSGQITNVEFAAEGHIRASQAMTGRRSILQADEDEQKSTMFYLKQGVVRRNLVIMAYLWAMCSFSYYMIIFYLKYLPGDIYSNTFSSSGTDMASVLFGGALYKRLGIKKTYSVLLSFSVVGGILIVLFGTNNEGWMPLFVIITKIGIAGCFVCVYICMVDVFPTLFLASAFGICNFLARILTIVAPQVAELEPPTPMIILTCLCALGILMVQFVIPLKQ